MKKLNTIKILVIDDDPSIVDALDQILTEEGYIAETISNAAKVYDTVKHFQPDLILLDILMSGSDGLTICRRLKAQPDTKHIPVIIISAHPSAPTMSKGAYADDVLAKPFGITDLLQKIQKHVSHVLPRHSHQNKAYRFNHA